MWKTSLANWLRKTASMSRYIFALAFCFWLQPAFSQNWYEVEIIVFGQFNPEAYSPGATAESWPENLNPQWPVPLVRLNAQTGPSPALRPLPVAERQLNNDAYALRVTDGYQVLWHQAWRQPMLSETFAPWIQIRGGSETQGRYQLEGALRIYLERFLHLDTNLWLSEFGENSQAPMPEDDQTLQPAFSLPTYKMAQPACAFFREDWPNNVIMEMPDLEPGEILDNWWFPPFDCSLGAIDLPAGLPLAKPIDPYVRVTLPTIRFEVVSDSDVIGPNPIQEIRPLFIENGALSTEAEETEQLVPDILQIIPMQQSRRMRSGELHYLDHPRLGVLAVIRPIDAPVLAPDEFSENLN